MSLTKFAAWSVAGLLILVMTAWLGGLLFLSFSSVEPIEHARPWTLYSYLYWFGANPKIEGWAYLSGFLAFALMSTLAFVCLSPRPASLHGDARWARRGEIRRANLLGDEGIIVGQLGGALLRHGGGSMVSPHVILAAPTGSGKTQGVMLPNALSWPGSLVALDMKGELYELSAGFRAKHGNAVYRVNFAPRDYQTHQYNPFAFVSADPNFLVSDVQRITNYLIQLGKGDDFWPQEARRLFIALTLYLYSTGVTPTLPLVRNLALAGDGSGFQPWCKKISADPALQAKLHPEAAISLTNFAHSADTTVAGVVQTVVSGLTPFLSDLTAAVVSGNSFDLRALREKAISVYLVVQPADIETLSPIIRLFFQQAVDLNTDIEFSRKPKAKHLVLFGMDEFASIGKVPAIQQSIAYMRSYGLRLLAIVQSKAQLQSVYLADGAKAFGDNFGASIYYTPAAEDIQGAKHISEVLGYQTVKGVSRSRRGAIGWDDKSRSETRSDQRRALMLPQEVMRLALDRMVLVVSGTPPIQAKKLFAAKDPRFSKRILAAPSVPTIEIAAPALASGEAKKETAMQDVTHADAQTLQMFDLTDFNLDFSDIPAPRDPVTDLEVENLVGQIYSRLMEPASGRVTASVAL